METLKQKLLATKNILPSKVMFSNKSEIHPNNAAVELITPEKSYKTCSIEFCM